MAVAPPDHAGVNFLGTIFVTPGGKSYAYAFDRRITNLYIVTGVR
jgi:hypothetical protein